MAQLNSKNYYMMAIIIGLGVGFALDDLPIGLLLTTVLIIVFGSLAQRRTG